MFLGYFGTYSNLFVAEKVSEWHLQCLQFDPVDAGMFHEDLERGHSNRQIQPFGFIARYYEFRETILCDKYLNKYSVTVGRY